MSIVKSNYFGAIDSSTAPWRSSSLGLDVEVFGDNSGTQSSGEVVVPNHDIAIAHIDCDRNHSLIHDVPLWCVSLASALS